MFYDDEGCRLFGEITRLPEYYPDSDGARRCWRTDCRQRSSRRIPQGSALVEYGASDEAKALPLLDHLGADTYVPIDIAGEALRDLTDRLETSRPALRVCPITADFLRPLDLPRDLRGQPCLGFFPGSTIGNLDRDASHRFLVQVRETLGPDARFLVGADLRKDRSILLPAYDDAQGVTAAFNMNLLSHLNREIGSDFDLDRFEHRAVWNDAEGRIEMHLVSRGRQVVTIDGRSVSFAPDETIHTENSYKHTIPGFLAMAEAAGWKSERVWTDARDLFSIHLLASAARPE